MQCPYFQWCGIPLVRALGDPTTTPLSTILPPTCYHLWEYLYTLHHYLSSTCPKQDQMGVGFEATSLGISGFVLFITG